MKQASLVRVLLSLALWQFLEALPQSSKKQNLDDSSSKDDVLELMGQPEPANCQNTSNSWAKGQSLWGKLQIADRFSLFQNVWNEPQLAPGSTNTIVCRSFSNGAVSWKVHFQMNSSPGATNNVKSYTNVGFYGNPKRIGDLQAFGSSWAWKLTEESTDLIADVSYDFFLSNDGTCQDQSCASTELMIWTAAIGGALPASSDGKSVGTIEATGRGGTYQFDVWKGVVSNKPVISLTPSGGKRYTSFAVNFRDLFAKLAKYGVRQDQYVTTIGAGVEVFKGSGILDTSRYSLRMKIR